MESLRLLVIATLVTSRALAQSCNTENPVDVLILGGGMAGVAAARTLHAMGKTNYIVFEANNKLGGRIRRDDTRNIELGANWIHGLDLADPNRHPLWREWRVCDSNGPRGSVTPMDGPLDIDFEKIYDERGNNIISSVSGTNLYEEKTLQFIMAEEIATKMSVSAAEDESVKTALEEGGWVPSDRLDRFIEWNRVDYCLAAKPQNLSLIHTLPQDTFDAFTISGGESSCYLVTDEKGYSFVVDCLARDFKDTTRLKLNAKVTKVETSDDCVCATVQGNGKYCASYAILTFSMGVLQAAIRGDPGAVHFEPELSKDAINQVTMVHFVKIFLKFNESFLKESETEDQQFFGYVSETRGHYPVFFTVKSILNTIHLHVTEDLALQVLSQGETTTMNEIMAILRKIYNNENIPNPVDIEISQWDIDPLFLGSYEAYGPGVPRDVFEKLHEPVNNRLYFAGSALNDSHYGFVHGAYGSGVHVATRVAQKLDGEDDYNYNGSSSGQYCYCT